MLEDSDLLLRTRKFAVASIKFYKSLPKAADAQVPGVQYLKASTAVDSNYRAAQRGRSRAEFIAKLGVVVEEIDGSIQVCCSKRSNSAKYSAKPWAPREETEVSSEVLKQ